MSYEDEVAGLTIHQTKPDDAGVYSCQATNIIGQVQTEGTLSVHSEFVLVSLNKMLKLLLMLLLVYIQFRKNQNIQHTRESELGLQMMGLIYREKITKKKRE